MTKPSVCDDKTQSGVVFAVDLGGTHLRAALIDDKGRIRVRFKQNTPQTGRQSDIVKAIAEAARSCMQGDESTTSYVSVAVPGTVNVKKGVVIKAPNLPCLEGFGLAAAVESELKLSAILENDANAAAVGEVWQGAARGCHAVVCVTLGTGVGGGIILNDKLWRGADGSAAEIGHMAVDPFTGVACACGSRGCLEVYASATAIVRMTRELSPQYLNSPLPKTNDLTAQKIHSAGLEGDELALEVFRRMGNYLGIGLATLINLLNPQMIVIAGGVVNGWNLFEKQMRQQVMERAFPIPAEHVRIVPGECGDDAGLLGAARLALDK